MLYSLSSISSVFAFLDQSYWEFKFCRVLPISSRILSLWATFSVCAIHISYFRVDLMDDTVCTFTPEPPAHEIVLKSHDYIASSSQVAGPSTSAPTTKRKRSELATPTPKKKTRNCGNQENDKDSQLDSQISAHRTPYGRLQYSKFLFSEIRLRCYIYTVSILSFF